MLCCIARDRNAYAAEHLCWHNGIAHWDVLFVKLLQDWELESMEVFSTPHLYSTMVGRNEEVKLVWLVACSGSFEVKLYYTVFIG